MNLCDFPTESELCCFLEAQEWKKGFHLLAEMRFVFLVGGLKNLSQMCGMYSYQLPQPVEEMLDVCIPINCPSQQRRWLMQAYGVDPGNGFSQYPVPL